MKLLQHKFVRLAPIFVIVIAVIFGLATLGSTVNPAPKNLPVLLAMEDRGASVPGQGDVNYGQKIAASVQAPPAEGQPASPFKWATAASERAGLDMLDREKAYALVVVPEGFTGKLLGLAQGAADAPEVKVYVNQGKNMTAATAVTTGLTQMLQGINAKLGGQLLEQLEAQGVKVAPSRAQSLAAPVKATTQLVNAVGTHSANGNAPGSLTQIAWMAALVGSLLVHFAMSKLRFKDKTERLGTLLLQANVGAVLSLVAGFGIVGVADWLLGLHVPSFLNIAFFLSLCCFSFYLMMSAVLSWIGMAGMPLFMLLFFFCGPILALAPEMLPDATKTLLYDWVPLRFAVEGLRDLFYFGRGLNITTPLVVLGSVAAGSLAVLLASALKRPKAAAASAPASASVEAVAAVEA